MRTVIHLKPVNLVVLLFLAVAAGCLGLSPVAAARDLSHAKPVTIRASLTRVPGYSFVSDGRYVLTNTYQGIGVAGTVLDTRTGRRTRFSRDGCLASSFSEGWLGLNCTSYTGSSSPAYELDNVATGQIRVLSGAATYQALGCDSGCGSIVGVGSQWVGLENPGIEHVSPRISFENLLTGQVRADPTNATTNVNLDSPGLATHVCRPVTIPPVAGVYGEFGDVWGSVTFKAGYAITAGYSGMYLERCGSRLHETLARFPTYASSGFYSCPAFACPPAINAHEVLWQSQSRAVIHGIFLPDRQRFTVHLPAGLVLTTMGLAGTKLYLSGTYGSSSIPGVWTIPQPTQPTSNTANRRYQASNQTAKRR